MSTTSMTKLLKHGLRNPRGAIEYLVPRSMLTGVEVALSSRMPIGENVLHEEWDLLIVLDTCRLDSFKQAQESGAFPWMGDLEIGSRRSVGGSTLEWTAQTFRERTRDLVADVDYIAGNMVVEDVLDGNRNPETGRAEWSPTAWDTLTPADFNEFVSVWDIREVRGPGQSHGSRPHPSAEAVTDVAIQHGREHSPDRTIVHYIQPHYPYYAAAEVDGREELEDWERYPFPKLMSGEVSREEVWATYNRELESALENIETLLDNFDAERVAITADHGEAFGEYLGYKHRAGTLHPRVRRVPWVLTTATDTHSHAADVDVEEAEMEREEVLEALGYL